jgi:hypothetical protein
MSRGRLLVAGALLAVVIVVAVALAGGGGGGDGSPTSISATVSRAEVTESPSGVVATARVRIGGIAGSKVELRWGLVDALSGRASVQDRVAKDYTTTASSVTHEAVVRFARPAVASRYIVNFALYGPDGSLLDSRDTGQFDVSG